MNFITNSLTLLYLCAFIYLTMCPSVHQVGGTVRHDVINKIGVSLQQSDINSDHTLDNLNYSNKTKATGFDHAKSWVVKDPRSSLPVLDLSVLSTVRLIL